MAYRSQQEVRFGDIDQAGIVYYPRFIHYFHVAMEEFFRHEVGIDYARVLKEYRLGHPTVHLEVDFRRPLRYGDHIEVEVGIEKIGRTSVTWRYTVYRQGETELVAEGQVVTVNLNLETFRKTELPERLRERLEAYRRRLA